MEATLDYPSIEQRTARGKMTRVAIPRESHGEWRSDQRRQSPLELLAEQATTRVPELVPIRHGRMAASPFAYFRGAALPMAADLATSANTGLTVQLCGDAHLANFGGFASPEREMVFDVNDFDETLPGPFEWDLKRLAASLEVAARSRGFDATLAHGFVLGAVRSYQQTIRYFASRPYMEVWYARMDVASMMQRWASKVSRKSVAEVESNIAKALARDHMKARSKLVRMDGARLRFVSDPPLLVPVDELFGEAEAANLRDSIHGVVRSYRRSLPRSRRRLLESYRFVDLARKVVGVGSVGTRAWVALFEGRDVDDPLILQIKEAEASVLERFRARSAFKNHGERVVEGQRLMQATGDIFLGWHRVPKGPDGSPHDYYVRQLWDWKLSANIDSMEPARFGVYAEMCGWTLARAHARSGDAIAIGAYLGGGSPFPEALATFARLYADQNDIDHQRLLEAISSGRFEAKMGV
jgi:uncharacterized protein (DUF2252 family)